MLSKLLRRRAKMVRPESFRELTDEELRHIGTHGTCPYCHGNLYEGPEAGMCINLLCREQGCWSRFNYCGFTGQYIGQER